MKVIKTTASEVYAAAKVASEIYFKGNVSLTKEEYKNYKRFWNNVNNASAY